MRKGKVKSTLFAWGGEMAVGGQSENRREKTGPFSKKAPPHILRIVLSQEKRMPRTAAGFQPQVKGPAGAQEPFTPPAPEVEKADI
jgi:hypothetical protein